MRLLPPAERRALRARAHHLHAVVTVGQHGLTAAVLREIDVNLRAHELIKVRVFSDEREGTVSTVAIIAASSSSRLVIRPWTSPTRYTS